MTKSEVSILMRAFGEALTESIRAVRQTFEDRFSAVESRIAAIPAGEKGEPGRDGNHGRDGIDGAAGKDGFDGTSGRDGKDGAPGPAGKDGTNGRDGIDGKPGKDGDAGTQGIPGRDGTDGAVGHRGADGAAGRDGKDGIDGKDGQRGADGKDGERGRDGKDGFNGKDGERGIDGRDGRDGKDGAAGRDALELEILDGIDETRKYPRGTFARHNGSLVRSTGETWQVIAAGLSGVAITQHPDDPRVIGIRLMYGDQSEEASFRVPVPLYRETYRADEEYLHGDMVTHDGCIWHCRTDKPKGMPGRSDEWRLAVKRGGDGRPGKPGDRGPQGLPGVDARYK